MLPSLLMRDHLVERVYQRNTGIGSPTVRVSKSSRVGSQAVELDLVAGGDEQASARAAESSQVTMAREGQEGFY